MSFVTRTSDEREAIEKKDGELGPFFASSGSLRGWRHSLAVLRSNGLCIVKFLSAVSFMTLRISDGRMCWIQMSDILVLALPSQTGSIRTWGVP